MNGHQKSRGSLHVKIIASLAIIAMIEILGFGILNYVNEKQKGLGVLINLSGRQRMLSQRITLLVHEYNSMDILASNIEVPAKINQELRDNLKLFMDSHATLFQEAKARAQNEELSLHYTKV